MGKGVTRAVENINKEIGPALVVRPMQGPVSPGASASTGVALLGHLLPSWWQQGWWPTLCSHRQLQGLIGLQGMNPVEQTAIDNKMKELDGTENKAKLGANAILAVSLAVAKVPCMACHVPGCSQSSALSSPDWSDCNRRD